MNNAERTRRELMIRAIKDYYDGVLADTIDRIPIDMRPRTAEPNRCCIYKDRAMLKYRLMALLGFGMEEERDETMPLREYLKLADAGKNHTAAVLSVCTVGCHGCVDSHVQVSSSCVGCFARPCVATCPRQAITVINQRSTIDRSKCINCGKCIAVCPYHAIIRNPLPCEDACPVGAIGKGEDGRVRIDFDRCIYCGKCFRACPFSAIMERSQLINILNALKSGRKVVAMVAPSITDQFPGKIEQLFAALKEAGLACPPRIHGDRDPARNLPLVKRYLQEHPEVTAVMTTNDDLALLVLKAAEELGIRVPDELSVVGFDDYPMSAYLCPSLTTVFHPSREAGIRAAESIAGYLESNGKIALKREVLPTELRIRSSTGRVKNIRKIVVI